MTLESSKERFSNAYLLIDLWVPFFIVSWRNLPEIYPESLFMQLLAASDCWEAFSGKSTEPKDLIFTRKRSSLFQLRTTLNVFLANNTTKVCDFKVKANLSARSWVVYIGESDTVAAKVCFLTQLIYIFYLVFCNERWSLKI